jgi:hypothetical protein
MEKLIDHTYHKKGGRPRKAITKNQQLAVMCTLAERKLIEEKAETANMSKSEYLRTIGLSGKIDIKIKVLPKEVLFFTATLNHLAANMNQIAHKRNCNDELTEVERAELNALSQQVKGLASDIKFYLK